MNKKVILRSHCCDWGWSSLSKSGPNVKKRERGQRKWCGMRGCKRRNIIDLLRVCLHQRLRGQTVIMKLAVRWKNDVEWTWESFISCSHNSRNLIIALYIARGTAYWWSLAYALCVMRYLGVLLLPYLSLSKNPCVMTYMQYYLMHYEVVNCTRLLMPRIVTKAVEASCSPFVPMMTSGKGGERDVTRVQTVEGGWVT